MLSLILRTNFIKRLVQKNFFLLRLRPFVIVNKDFFIFLLF
jgi:hypothetical protein